MDKFFKWAGLLAWGIFLFVLVFIAFDTSNSDGTRAVAAVTFVAFQLRDEFQKQSEKIKALSDKLDRLLERDREPDEYSHLGNNE